MAANDSSVPALRSQASRVPNAAAIQAAATAVQKESKLAPGHDGERQLHHQGLAEQRGQGHRDPTDQGAELDQDRTHDHADQTP